MTSVHTNLEIFAFSPCRQLIGTHDAILLGHVLHQGLKAMVFEGLFCKPHFELIAYVISSFD